MDSEVIRNALISSAQCNTATEFLSDSINLLSRDADLQRTSALNIAVACEEDVEKAINELEENMERTKSLKEKIDVVKLQNVKNLMEKKEQLIRRSKELRERMNRAGITLEQSRFQVEEMTNHKNLNESLKNRIAKKKSVLNSISSM